MLRALFADRTGVVSADAFVKRVERLQGPPPNTAELLRTCGGAAGPSRDDVDKYLATM